MGNELGRMGQEGCAPAAGNGQDPPRGPGSAGLGLPLADCAPSASSAPSLGPPCPLPPSPPPRQSVSPRPCVPPFQLEQLANPKAWINAATQIFFSLGLGFGSLIAFASYSQPSSDCQKHAVLVSLINSATSIFASIVTFSIYGFKATFNYESCVNK